MDKPDKELLEGYKAGDLSAFESLVRKYKNPLFSYILGMVRTHEEADDVFQDVWFRAIKNIDSFDGRKFLSWLFRIAHNLLIDKHRKARPMLSLDEKKDESFSLLESLTDNSDAPYAAVMEDETNAMINRALVRLPEQQREVFLLRVQAELPFREIARIQKVSINTALARMQYALAKLRALISEDAAFNGGDET